jgi:hypothetical protein
VGPRQDAPQPLLAFDERQATQVLSVQEPDVEDAVAEIGRGARGILQQLEVEDATRVEGNQLPVDHRVMPSSSPRPLQRACSGRRPPKTPTETATLSAIWDSLGRSHAGIQGFGQGEGMGDGSLSACKTIVKRPANPLKSSLFDRAS